MIEDEEADAPHHGEDDDDGPALLSAPDRMSHRDRARHGHDEAQGDPTGSDFDAFVAEVEGRVRRALIPVAGTDAARDATVDALVHAWKRWDRVQTMANPAGYVYTVARSRLRLPPPSPGELPEGLVDPRRFPDVEPRLARLLAELPERQRVAVYLLHGCGWSTPEVADLLGVSVSTVRNHANRALKRLRRELGVEPTAPRSEGPAR